MSDLYPAYNANDAPALYAVLAALLANTEPPPRADVVRIPDGRLFQRGKCHTDLGEHTGYHVWYCCVRLGRTVPVHDRSATGGVGSADYDAPWDQFSCIPGDPQYRPGGASDRWRDLYDDAYAALT